MAGEKLPWMPFFGTDFYEDDRVADMDLDEQGAYVRLLWCAWREGGIPADPTKIRRRLGACPRKEFDRIWQAIAPCWIPHPDDPSRLVQPRQEIERAEAEKKSKRGRDAAAVRWERERARKAKESRNA